MRRALGRGLDALIPGAGKAAGAPTAEVEPAAERLVTIDALRPNARQPRTGFDETTLAELTESIRVQGVIQPILVRPADDGSYEIVAGERRFRAAQRAGLREVPVVVRALSDAESLEVALIENLQRDDLSPLEEAAAYQKLIDEFGHTQEQIAERVGKSRPAISNTLRLLRLPDSIKQELARGRLSAGHARVLLSIDNADAQLRAARQILARELSVRETERLGGTRRKATSRATVRGAGQDLHRQALERELSAALGTRVRVQPRGRGGQIEIEYYSNEELQGLSDRLCQRRSQF
jgi:ParB family transcriptional regulator, chromosome partitioning protein